MKNWILIGLVLVALNASGQTKLIALKSHSGELSALKNETDGNFGIVPARLDSVIKIGPSCVVEINNHGFRDTIYEHPYFLNPDVSLNQLKKLFPRIHFVGFDKHWAPVPKKKPTSSKGVLYFIALTVSCWGLSQLKLNKKTVV